MIHLQVDGLTCASCVAAAEAALRTVPGVVDASVSLAEHAAFVEGAADTQALIVALRKAGHEARLATGSEVSAHGAALRARLLPWMWLALGLVVALLGMSEMAGLRAGSLESALVQAALTLVLLCAAWRPVLLPGARALLRLRPEMNALVGIGIATAFSVSAVQLVRGHYEHLHFESAALITAFVLLGRALEGHASAASAAAFRALAAQVPARAEVIRRGERVVIAAAELRPRDILCVRAGEALAADGVIESGQTSLNEAWRTGESLPVDRGPGAAVRAGSINLSGELRVRVSAVGGDSHIGRIVEALRTAGRRKTPVERTCDRVAAVFTPVVLLLAAGTLAGWWLAGDATRGVEHMVAVLLVACPCSLGLATPAAVTAALGRAARMGLIVRDPAAFEAAAVARHVVLDKTGTLTTDTPTVARVVAAPGSSAAEVLSLAAALEAGSLHPYGAAVCAAAAASVAGRTNGTASDVVTHPGQGVEGCVAGAQVRFGRGSFARGAAAVDPLLLAAEREMQSAGCGIAWLLRDGCALGVISFQAELRGDAVAAVRALKAAHLQVRVLSGDHAAAVARVAQAAGIEHAHAELCPEEKLEALRALSGGVVMVGDGINDGPALAAASVGIAIHGAADVARAAGSVIALRPGLLVVPQFIALARCTRSVIRQNLALAFAYNILALPAAMGLLGFTMPPAAAALSMSGSCLLLLANSLRLARWRAG